MHRSKKILAAFIAALPLLTPSPARAQSPEAEAATARFSREKAVVFEDTEELRFAWKDGELTATSTVVRDILPISDAAAFNNGTVYHSYFHTLEDLDAQTLVPNGKGGYKKVSATGRKTTSTSSESVFYDDGQQTTVTFPGLVSGARTRIEYRLRHNDLHLLTPFHFAGYMPMVESRYSVVAPRGVKLKFIVRADASNRIRRSEEVDKRGATIYTFLATDVPRFESFPNAPSTAYFLPQVITQIESIQPPDADAPTTFLSSTADLYRFYYNFIREVNNKPDDSVRALAASLTAGAASDREKAARIYRWVQEHIRYVAFEDGTGGFIPREAGAVCTRRYGDCKDMSSLLVALCQAAKLDAHYTWIGTRHLPYTYTETPLPIADNHMICGLRLDGQWIFMDGTDGDLPFGLAPAGLQGKEALISINEKKFEVVKVPEAPAASNTTLDSTRITLGTDGALAGAVHLAYTGYPAWDLTGFVRYSAPADRDQTFRRLTARGSNKYTQRSFDYIAASPKGDPFRIKSGFELKDYARTLDGEYFVNMNLSRLFEDDAVNPATRGAVPIEHEYKQRVRQVVVLEIPAGYKVSYLPPAAESGEPGVWRYRIHYEKSAKEVRLVKEYEVETLHIEAKNFAAHNKMVEALRKAYKESVVLEK